jgi:hypothetical protein
MFPGMSALTKGIRGLSVLGMAAGFAIAVAGPASADTLNTTTCSGQQVMSSLQKNAPMIWGKISSDPQTEQKLKVALDVVLTAPPGQREQLANTLEQALGKDQMTDISDDVLNASGGPIGRAVNACHNF